MTFLFESFGNPLLVVKTYALFDELLELPCNAVLAWIKRDDLKVHSENDLVYLLDKWMEKNKPSHDERDALMKEIKVINLGPAYLIQILPNLPCIKDSILSKHHQSAVMAAQFKSTSIERLISLRMSDLPPS